ncbi:hypothetical protein ACTI_82130 [Actinoplanes sp. OR16]|uniref:AbfB domain-containing protein n=1 Tax=Actinoplanes sp. OR16 TaxID=946334 RepID=UPI000F6CC457|nr:AbfB domain-containing protein [Actinoplanes sp. OR16]BBH71528.1 hypothetical protein ACTI_82130 [Actinoplanes sp. OR16]
MPEDEGLRVGGWVPPYSTDQEAGNLPARPALPRTPERLALGPGRSAPPPSARHFLILAAVAALGCGVTAIVALNRTEDPAPVAQQSRAPRVDLPAFPIQPEETIPLLPAPTSEIPTLSAAAPAAPVATRSASPSPDRSWRTVEPSPAKTTPPPAPQPVRLTAGSTVGLELLDRPGYRVRHQHYEGRIAAISSSDPEEEKNDARFVIRKGRAALDCFSLESVNFPGYYLRHRDFVIHLDRAENSNLFDLDSTFCSESIRGGSAIALRAYNYPSRWIAANGDRLAITESGATAFRPGRL